MAQEQSARMLSEMMVFATFSAAEQRYVRRSLDVGLNRRDAAARWARGAAEAACIEEQARRYRTLDLIRACVPDDDDPGACETFLASLISLASADLREGKIESFDSYRFLYERLIGPEARPWLLGAFCAAAAMPTLHPDLRRKLMESIPVSDVTAAGWSLRPSLFYPEWVEKVSEAVN
jgi:hypothetical protein